MNTCDYVYFTVSSSESSKEQVRCRVTSHSDLCSLPRWFISLRQKHWGQCCCLCVCERMARLVVSILDVYENNIHLTFLMRSFFDGKLVPLFFHGRFRHHHSTSSFIHHSLCFVFFTLASRFTSDVLKESSSTTVETQGYWEPFARFGIWDM